MQSKRNPLHRKFKLRYILAALMIMIITVLVYRDSGVDHNITQTANIVPVATSSDVVIVSTAEVQTSTSSGTTTIIAFGDSITAGYGLPYGRGYPEQLGQLLQDRGYQVHMINAGVSGETTAGGLRRVDFIIRQKPDIVILALGGNDALRGIDPKSTSANLAQIIEALKRAHITIILAGMYAPENLGPTYVKEFDTIYTSLSAKYVVTLVPFLLRGVALDPQKNQPDGIHPNEVGAQIIAKDNLLPALLPFLP